MKIGTRTTTTTSRERDVRVGEHVLFGGFPAVITAVGEETCNLVVTLDGPAGATRLVGTGGDAHTTFHGTHAWVQHVTADAIEWPEAIPFKFRMADDHAEGAA